MTIRLWMTALSREEGIWGPSWQCNRCEGEILAAGRVMWNADSPHQLIGFLAVCGETCSQWLRDNVEDVSNWGTMDVAEFIFMLAAGTLTTTKVGELLDREAYGAYINANLKQNAREDPRES